MYRLEYLLLPLILLGGPLTSPLEAQLRDVVSSQIAVSQDEATLELELDSDEAVEISLREGEVTVDGDAIGSYSRGDALDTSWRTLLGEAVALDNGPLARALVDWSPPADLAGNGTLEAVAERLDQLLEERLTQADPESTEQATPAESGTDGEMIRLLRRADRLGVLGQALTDLDLGAGSRIAVDEDVVVAAGEEVAGSLVVVDGNLDVQGTIRGDVAVTGGRLRLEEGGRIVGDVRLADAGLSRDGGTVEGTVTEIPEARIRLTEALADLDDLDDFEDLDDLDDLERLIEVDDLEEDLRDRIRAEVEADMESDFWREYGGSGFSRPLRNVGRGLGGLLENVIGFLVALLLAFGVTQFFPGNLKLVEKATERSPGRSALVGLAGLFLLVPAYILGMVVLAVSIVGIPVLLLWIPLFPLAVAVGAGLGYLAVALLLGRWIIRQDFKGLDFLRRGNDLHAAAAGLGALLVPYAVANILLIGGPWLGAIHSLFQAVGVLAGVLTLVVGFGAVLLTRGGRRPIFAGGGVGMDDPGTSPWETEREPAGTGSEWGTDWEDDWQQEWDEEWEDLEREARGRSEGPAPSPDEDGDAGDQDETEDDSDEVSDPHA